MSPGMIWGRSMGETLGIYNAINILGIDNISLVFLLVEDGKFERFGLVEQGDQPGRVFANRDLSIAERVSRAVGLDLIDDLFELEGQVFGKNASFLPGKDMSQISPLRKR